MQENPSLLLGLNVAFGKVTLADIATQFDYPYTPAEDLLITSLPA
jgi:alanine dehydrogenase